MHLTLNYSLIEKETGKPNSNDTLWSDMESLYPLSTKTGLRLDIPQWWIVALDIRRSLFLSCSAGAGVVFPNQALAWSPNKASRLLTVVHTSKTS